ncbi:type VI secretion system baseplate subunit TssG [Pseudorhodobacter sp. E13]|uniref:type VI secretion system baseplate subunit TssG n=1 Tax=Pseudorhodobacter sp. E13 TaxID=2487931 RepID=UPI000F8E6835|nr:type VI secretion system baseplate subunit TssG [Pseudorhodobacter sp. E13]RUS59685.1 type VI secretion system baseplate subunit TssG [Pseudorhodobacter sp. E13]
METGDGAGQDHLTHYAQLLAEPEKYHIFRALRILEAQFPDLPRLGESTRPRQEPFRLEQEAELAFPPSTIAKMVPPAQGKPGRLINRFFGLFGPHGPLPLHLTEFARDRQRNHRDPTFLAFGNMLTHRLFGLFYRAYAVAHPAPSFDRSLKGNRAGREVDPFARKVAALSGHYEKGFNNRDEMPDMAKRHFVGHLTPGPKHAHGLVSIISGFVRAPVTLQQFVGQWLELEPGDRWQLGSRVGLGLGTSIGSKVWSHAAKFRLRIGPLTLKDFERMMPGSPSLARLEAIVRNYVGDTLDWDINLVLRREEVPQAVLGQTTMLGHTSWIGTRTGDTDADDLYLIPRSLVQRRSTAE